MPSPLGFPVEDLQLLYILFQERELHRLAHIELVFDPTPKAFAEYRLFTLQKKCVSTELFNVQFRKYYLSVTYLSTCDLQNGRLELSSIIRCMPMSEINTADSVAAHSTHIKTIVLARKLDICEERGKKNHIHTDRILFVIIKIRNLKNRYINKHSNTILFRNNHFYYFDVLVDLSLFYRVPFKNLSDTFQFQCS